MCGDIEAAADRRLSDLRLRRLPVPLCYDAEWLAVQKAGKREDAGEERTE